MNNSSFLVAETVNDKNLYNKIKNLADYAGYLKRRKINLAITVILFLIIIIYLIVASYKNDQIVWICTIVPILLFLLGSLIGTTYNTNKTQNDLINKVKSNWKDIGNSEKPIEIKLEYKQLHQKRTDFFNQLIYLVYLEVEKSLK